MASVYLETSIFGYLASRPFKEQISAANQQLTINWWNNQRPKYELFVSPVVKQECDDGDPEAAKERAVFLAGIPLLTYGDETIEVAVRLLKEVRLPEKASADTLHIAIAATHGIDYLLTWNCRHIANPSLRRKIEGVLKSANFATPIICTPQELYYV